MYTKKKNPEGRKLGDVTNVYEEEKSWREAKV